ncbi:MAG: GyrI-like domain-containing protein [Actinomycetota bacterium]|nr:GyrI-like domain-containing protein [Actinomycetota bacterium]
MTEFATQVVQTTQTHTAGIRRVVPAHDIASFFDYAYTAVVEEIQAQGASIIGPGFARYFSVPAETFDLEAGFPTDTSVTSTDEVIADVLPAGRAARAVHLGSYDGLALAWMQLDSWIEEQGLTRTGPMWEVYVTMPTPDANPDDMRTDLFIAVE